jgi:hypothetical protein
MEHKYIAPETHNCNNDAVCPICDGGLSVCSVCGGAEGSMPTECPGFMMSPVEAQAVYKGEIDFRNGAWVQKVSPHSPAYYREAQKAGSYQGGYFA